MKLIKNAVVVANVQAIKIIIDMKKIFFLLIVICSLYQANAQFTNATLTASGLTCSMCSKAIYKALIQVPFVEKVTANVKESSYNIIFKEGITVSFDALKKSVQDAGFFVAKLTVTTNFSNTAVKNDSHILLGNTHLHFLNITDKTLDGPVSISIIDKGFVDNKTWKQYSKSTTMKCFETGTIQSCCSKDGAGERIYHVTI